MKLSKMDETNPTKVNETKPPADSAVGLFAASDLFPKTSADFSITDDRPRITGDRSEDDRMLTTHHQHDHR